MRPGPTAIVGAAVFVEPIGLGSSAVFVTAGSDGPGPVVRDAVGPPVQAATRTASVATAADSARTRWIPRRAWNEQAVTAPIIC